MLHQCYTLHNDHQEVSK
ncbi:hypothetical protein MTR67_018626 [Solanum verrucosum]|uniref:Uncharacterized protein n=1 Tax=Solanum verrucosum TaxID=315347 RepID=A0AAF0QR48_SOLVR|nr:hypothetical protein MTR67_018626 [Solanum verrucosum]